MFCQAFLYPTLYPRATKLVVNPIYLRRMAEFLEGGREIESISLHRRVFCESAFLVLAVDQCTQRCLVRPRHDSEELLVSFFEG